MKCDDSSLPLRFVPSIGCCIVPRNRSDSTCLARDILFPRETRSRARPLLSPSRDENICVSAIMQQSSRLWCRKEFSLLATAAATASGGSLSTNRGHIAVFVRARACSVGANPRLVDSSFRVFEADLARGGAEWSVAREFAPRESRRDATRKHAANYGDKGTNFGNNGARNCARTLCRTIGEQRARFSTRALVLASCVRRHVSSSAHVSLRAKRDEGSRRNSDDARELLRDPRGAGKNAKAENAAAQPWSRTRGISAARRAGRNTKLNTARDEIPIDVAFLISVRRARTAI